MLFERVGPCPLGGGGLLVVRDITHGRVSRFTELRLMLSVFFRVCGQLCLQGFRVLAGTIDFLIGSIFDSTHVLCERISLCGRRVHLAGQPFRQFGLSAFEFFNACSCGVALLRQILNLSDLMLHELLGFGQPRFRKKPGLIRGLGCVI